jgi:capsid protein
MMSWGPVPVIEEQELPWVWPESAGPPPEAEASSAFPTTPSGAYDGSNFLEGVDGLIDQISTLDYWTLRARSAALFYGNSYGRGIVRRFVTDIINTGLTPESIPEESILGLPDDSLSEWSEMREKRFRLYGESKEIIDAKGYREDGVLQAQIYLEALVAGDCLVICRQDKDTGLPQLQIVNGDRVQTPPDRWDEENLVDGVKLDDRGRHLGYWVYQGTNEIMDDRWAYIPTHGASTGRRTAWMVYGIDKREDGVRGEPLLAIAIQPLNEILKYRGAAQLKAAINSMIIGFIKRTQDKPASLPVQGGAVKKTTVANTSGTTSPVNLTQIMPGVFMERLQPGEEPVPHSVHGTDVNFGQFEAAVMVGLSWALQIPPEILLMSFNKNYSASQAATNKWKTLIAKERPRFAAAHPKNLWEEWFIAELMLGKFEAAGFFEAFRDPKRYDEKRAWLQTEWFGQVEPSVDIVKQTTGYKAMVNEGWTTNTRTARELNGSKWSHNIKQVAKENVEKAKAMRPLLDLQKEFGNDAVEAVMRIAPELLAMAQAGAESGIES